MNINEFLDMSNCYEQQISQSRKIIRKEEKLLDEAWSKYDALYAQAYEEGLFKLSLGKLKEVIASYNNIPISQISLTLKGSAKLFFALDGNYRKLISFLKKYPDKARKIKIVASVTSSESNLRVSFSPVNFCHFLIENENLFSTNGNLNDNLQFENAFDKHGDLCSTINFAPEYIEKVVINIHPKQLEMYEDCEVLKPALVNYLEKKTKDKEL